MSGLPPTAPAQGKQPLRQDLQEAQSAPAWRPSEQHAGKQASSGKGEAAQLRTAKALLGWSRVHLQYGRAPALLRGPIWQSSWLEVALSWERLAQTCLAARLPAQEGAGCARLGDALAPSWPQLRSCLAFAPRPQASLGRSQGPVACTQPRAPAMRALSEGREGQLQRFRCAWPPRLSPLGEHQA